MKKLLSRWKTLPQEHRDYLFIYLWGAAWFVVYFAFSPASTYILLDRTIIALWSATAVLGAIVSITGLLKGDSLLTERAGVTLTMIGPIAYAVTQLSLIIASNFSSEISSGFDRLHLVFLGLWPLWFLRKRFRQIGRRIKEVKETPLASEEEDVAGGTRA